MSFEDLESRDIFLPEESWGELDTSSSVPPIGVALLGAVGAGACALMAVGGGGVWTWAGALLYVLFLPGFTLLSDRGARRQARRVDELRRAAGEEP